MLRQSNSSFQLQIGPFAEQLYILLEINTKPNFHPVSAGISHCWECPAKWHQNSYGVFTLPPTGPEFI